MIQRPNFGRRAGIVRHDFRKNIGCWGTWGVLVSCEIGFAEAGGLEMLLIVLIGGDSVWAVWTLYSGGRVGLGLPLIMSAKLCQLPRCGVTSWMRWIFGGLMSWGL